MSKYFPKNSIASGLTAGEFQYLQPYKKAFLARLMFNLWLDASGLDHPPSTYVGSLKLMAEKYPELAELGLLDFNWDEVERLWNVATGQAAAGDGQ